MVKDSISKDIATETVQNVSLASSRTVELLRTNAVHVGGHIRSLMGHVEKLTKANSELTTVSIGVGLLCSGMFGLWFTILMRSGI